MTGSVKELIRSIRSCKTPAEERAVLARECAEIRSSINGNSSSTRQKNISKLLLIHLLGHSTNFGQVECIKLIASNKFSDKRIGYLALNLLLNEDAEVLTLAINSIKMDLSSANPYITELALNALSNIGNTDMFRELHYDIERLMKSSTVNVRKKAIVCAARMLRKIGQASMIPGPDAIDLAGTYVHAVPALLGDPNHGVVSAALTVLSALIDYFPMCINYASIYELLVKTLNSICNEGGNAIGIMFGGSKDYEVNGVNDPFLKSKILQILRNVYSKCRQQVAGNQQLYDLVNNIVKASTLSNNATNTLLYECVRTIYSEFNDPKFNQLGKDIVQKFMKTNDNNIKYIALGILNNLMDVTMEVGDSNWNIIVQSLRQPDISIRRRALDVAIKLVTRETLRPLMQHMYDFLLAASNDLKRESIPKIAATLESYSDCEYYKLEMMIKIFATAGNCVPEAIIHSFIASVSVASQGTQMRVAAKLYYVIGNNMSQDALVRVTLWCFGEYAHMVPELSQVDVTPTNSMTAQSIENKPAQRESEDLISMLDIPPLEEHTSHTQGATGGHVQILMMIEALAKHIIACSGTNTSACTNGEYLLTCAGKLAYKLPEERSRLMKLIRRFKKHSNIELQQRACELEILFEHDSLHVLAPSETVYALPVIEFASIDLMPKTVKQQPSMSVLGGDLLQLGEEVNPKKTSEEKLSTLDFMTFDYSTKENKTNDEFGQFDPF